MPANTKLIVIAVLAILAAIVMFQNTQSVETKILFVSIAMPRFVLLAVTALVGFAIGVLMATKKKKPKS